MVNTLDTIATYVPSLVIDRANAGKLAFKEPTLEVFPAAALFVDVSGFTALSERLAAQGPSGAEVLTGYLNQYFGPLLDIIQRYGGDTVKFAGDALLALWRADPGDLPDKTLVAAECALAVQHELKDFRAESDLQLSLKMVLGAGDIAVEFVGGVFDRWELLITGAPLSQIAEAQYAARPGEVVLATEIAPLLDGRAQTEPAAENAIRLTALARRRREAAARPAPLPHTVEPLRRLLPGAIRSRIEAGQQDWLGELRHLSVIFINLPGFTFDLSLERAQEAMRAMQSALYRFEGSINKISIDDKGASLVALLGLPPLSHHDDPERAVHAAQLMRSALQALDFDCSIGITTGTAFCGAVGSASRREYTVMGDVVNLAARLMLYAEGGVLCDEATARGIATAIPAKPLGAITVKGKAEPVPIYLPQAPGPREWRHAGAGRHDLIGRDAERRQLREAVAALRAGKPSSVVIDGETGIGKTRLLLDLIAHAEAEGCAVLSSAADPIERATPYFMWRAILVDLFGLDLAAGDAEALRLQVLNHLPDDPEVIENAPLLGALLAIAWPDNAATGALSGQARADRTHLAVCRIFERLARRLPLVLIVKDVQWLDSASWELLHQVRGRVPRVLVVVALRSGDSNDQVARFRRTPHRHLALQGLALEDLNLLLSRKLKVETLPRDVASMIHEQTGGNPFFAEELVRTLLDSDRLRVDQNTGEVTLALGMKAADVPRTVQSAIVSRIDRLPPDAQLTLKVASILGRLFTAEALAAVYPVPATAQSLAGHLDLLEKADLVGPLVRQTFLHTDGTGRPFKFKNTAVQDAAYGLMLYAQRRTLHAAAASWLEAAVTHDKAGHAAAIAQHRARAVDERKPDRRDLAAAVAAHERAAEHAAFVYANREAVASYRAALHLLGLAPDDDTRAQHELRLLLALGAPLIATTSWADPEVRSTYARARELGARVGGYTDVFRALRGMWQFHAGEGEIAVARGLAAEMIALAESSGDPVLRIEANRTLGNNAFFAGMFGEARRYLEAAIAPYDAAAHAGLAAQLGQDPDVANRGILSWALCFLGDPAGALDQVERAVAHAEELDHPFTRAFAYGAAMWCHKFLWQPDEADRWAGRCLAVCEDHGIAYLEVAARVIRGWARARRGETDAIPDMRGTIDRWRTTANIGTAPFLYVLADSACAVGQEVIARSVLDDPLLAERTAQERWLEAEIQCLTAALLHGRDIVKAVHAYRAAAEAAQAQGNALSGLRAAMGLAHLAGETRRARDGEALLRAAIERFGAAPDTGIMTAAREALTAAGSRKRRLF